MPPFDFPNFPTDGQVITGPGGTRYTWHAASNNWRVPQPAQFVTQQQLEEALKGQEITTGDTAPASPNPGDLWFDTTEQILKIWDGSAWIASTGDLTGFLPLSGGTLSGNLYVTTTSPLPLATSAIIASTRQAFGGFIGSWSQGSQTNIGFWNNSDTWFLGNANGAGVPFATRANIDSTGNLNVGGGIASLYGDTGFSVTTGTNSRLLSFGVSTRFEFTTDTGIFGWVSGGNYVMRLDSIGNLTNLATITMTGNGIIYSFGDVVFHSQGLFSGNLYPVINGGLSLGAYQVTGSDRRMKRNVEPAVGDALADLAALNVVSFDRVTTLGDAQHRKHMEFGLIADEVVQVAPDAVIVPDDEAQFKSLDLLPLMARCVKAIQQLSEEVRELKRRM